MSQPLENIKVVDLTRTLAGPFCTQNLADMGADVIKIEEPNDGDETRKWPPIWNGESTQFMSFNRNKRSLSVNLKSEEGLSIVKKLATEADVMIESFRAGTLARMGLGYEDIKAINPDIVYCTISGYGRTGPMANKPGYDLIIQAYSGLMHLTGAPDGPPQRVGFSLVDLFTGMLAYGSIVTALYHRDKTGEGQLIDTALLDGQVAAMSYHATGYIGTGIEPHRLGSGHPSLVPYQSFQASDGFFIPGRSQPQPLGAVLQRDRASGSEGRPQVRHESRPGGAPRRDGRPFERHLLEQHCGALGQGDRRGGCPRRGQSTKHPTWSADEQVNAREMFLEINHPHVPDLRVPNSPIKLQGTPAQLRMAPPLLGEHNEEVLAELGYDSEEFAKLLESGAVGEPGKEISGVGAH